MPMLTFQKEGSTQCQRAGKVANFQKTRLKEGRIFPSQ